MGNKRIWCQLGLLLVLWATLFLYCGCSRQSKRSEAPQHKLPKECLTKEKAAGFVCICDENWPTFHHDNGRTGYTNINFASAKFVKLWTFNLSEHVWKYTRRTSVWSSSPAIATIKGKTIVFIGAYDHNLYAIDAYSGKKLWRFTTGGTLNFSPAFAIVKGIPIVYITSSDRTIYAVHALTGAKLWNYETMKWSYTVSESMASSPVIGDVNGRAVVFVGFWNTDRRPFKSIQRGELFAFDAYDGKKIWSKVLSTTSLSSPSLAKVDGKPIVFIASADGIVYALDAASGNKIWSCVAGHQIYSSPTVASLGGKTIVYIADFFGMIYCFDAKSGKILWSHKTGHQINSTTALANVDGRPLIFVGSYDRCLHAIHAGTGQRVWSYKTEKYVCSSPAIAKINGSPAVFFNSLDDKLYVLDARSGARLWSYKTGSMLWAYETRGDTIWSSPAIAVVDDMPILLFASYDGKFYAFRAQP